jgi:proteasome alpha subunit
VADEHGFVAMGGQADQVTAVLKERYAEGLPLASALGVAIAALSGQDGNGERAEIGASQLEVAVLARDRVHRTFRRVGGSRLENLLAEARPPGQAAPAAEPPTAEPGTPTGPDGDATP